MSSYIEFNDRIAFHPGYYVKEVIEDSGLTQEDFAKRLGTTPKNLSILVRGEQRLSIDIALKLARLLDTSVDYWLNLQKIYDSLCAEFKSGEELLEESRIFNNIDYNYFKEFYGFPSLSRKVDEQIIEVRKFLKVASLAVLKKADMAVRFRGVPGALSEANIIKANIMVQIATNIVLKTEAPKYDKTLFEEAVNYALTLTKEHSKFYPLLKESLRNAGVIFVILPNMPGSKINGATKKVGNKIMLMVNDRRLYSDTFWFTLFHEISHILKDDHGISFESEVGEQEEIANQFAEDMLIPNEQYQKFIEKDEFNLVSIKEFASQIDRDPGIVLGRLLKEGKVNYKDVSLNSLRHKYKVELKRKKND